MVCTILSYPTYPVFYKVHSMLA